MGRVQSSASACMSAYATGTSDGNTDDQKCAALAAFSDCAAGIPATDVLKDVVRQLERTNADALAVCNKVEKVQVRACVGVFCLVCGSAGVCRLYAELHRKEAHACMKEHLISVKNTERKY